MRLQQLFCFSDGLDDVIELGPFFLHHGLLEGERFLQDGWADLQAVLDFFQREA